MSLDRVATAGLSAAMITGMQSGAARLAEAQAQLSSGRKATDLAGFGAASGSIAANQSLVDLIGARQQNLGLAAAKLSRQNAEVDTLTQTLSDLRTTLSAAAGNRRGARLDQTLDTAFSALRSALNAAQGGHYIFAGARTGQAPFTAANRAAASAAPDTASLFANDQTVEAYPLGDGRSLAIGLVADRLGSAAVDAFRTLGTGSYDGDLSDAQVSTLEAAVSGLDGAITTLQAAEAGIGANQRAVDTATTQLGSQQQLLKGVIGDAQDADMAEVATRIAAETTQLQASYASFASTKSLSLASYLG